MNIEDIQIEKIEQDKPKVKYERWPITQKQKQDLRELLRETDMTYDKFAIGMLSWLDAKIVIEFLKDYYYDHLVEPELTHRLADAQRHLTFFPSDLGAWNKRMYVQAYN